MTSSRDPIEIRLAPGDDGADLSHAAARLGAPVTVTAAESGPTTIGGVPLPSRPESWRVDALLLRALAPKHILFLCVANSARSQLAEALARSFAPVGMKISSAGSEPSRVRPEAIAVLEEIGVGASGLRSKGVEEIERPVDAVITLCAEEVCPAWLGNAWRLHWGLPDPAAVEGSEEQRMDRFRAARDELMGRLSVALQRPTVGDG